MAVQSEGMRPPSYQFAARSQEMLDQAFPQSERVRSMAVLAHRQAAHVVARQSRLELTQLISVEFVDLDSVFAAQVPGGVVLFQALKRPVHIKMAKTMDE